MVICALCMIRIIIEKSTDDVSYYDLDNYNTIVEYFEKKGIPYYKGVLLNYKINNSINKDCYRIKVCDDKESYVAYNGSVLYLENNLEHLQNNEYSFTIVNALFVIQTIKEKMMLEDENVNFYLEKNDKKIPISEDIISNLFESIDDNHLQKIKIEKLKDDNNYLNQKNSENEKKIKDLELKIEESERNKSFIEKYFVEKNSNNPKYEWINYNNVDGNATYHRKYYTKYMRENIEIFKKIFEKYSMERIKNGLSICIVGGGNGWELKCIDEYENNIIANLSVTIIDKLIWPLNEISKCKNIKNINIIIGEYEDILKSSNISYDIIIFSRCINYTENKYKYTLDRIKDIIDEISRHNKMATIYFIQICKEIDGLTKDFEREFENKIPLLKVEIENNYYISNLFMLKR